MAGDMIPQGVTGRDRITKAYRKTPLGSFLFLSLGLILKCPIAALHSSTDVIIGGSANSAITFVASLSGDRANFSFNEDKVTPETSREIA